MADVKLTRSDGQEFSFPEDKVQGALQSGAFQLSQLPAPVPSNPPGSPSGQLVAGNIDLKHRPVVKNKDGSISTVRSMSFGEDGKEILVPTVSEDGRIMSDDEAVDQYHKTGKHLGKFDSPDAANAYAQQLHQDQEKLYAQPNKPVKPEQTKFIDHSNEELNKLDAGNDEVTPAIDTVKPLKQGQEPYFVTLKDKDGNEVPVPEDQADRLVASGSHTVEDMPLTRSDGKIVNIPNENIPAALQTGQFRLSTRAERAANLKGDILQKSAQNTNPIEASLLGFSRHLPLVDVAASAIAGGISGKSTQQELADSQQDANLVAKYHPGAYYSGATLGEVGSAVGLGGLAGGLTKSIGLKGVAKLAAEGAVYSTDSVVKNLVDKNPAGAAESLALGVGMNFGLHGIFSALEKVPGLAGSAANEIATRVAGEPLEKEGAENLIGKQILGLTPNQVAKLREKIDIGPALKAVGITADDIVSGAAREKLQSLEDSGPKIGAAIKELDELFPSEKKPIIEEHLNKAIQDIQDMMPPEVKNMQRVSDRIKQLSRIMHPDNLPLAARAEKELTEYIDKMEKYTEWRDNPDQPQRPQRPVEENKNVGTDTPTVNPNAETPTAKPGVLKNIGQEGHITRGNEAAETVVPGGVDPVVERVNSLGLKNAEFLRDAESYKDMSNVRGAYEGATKEEADAIAKGEAPAKNSGKKLPPVKVIIDDGKIHLEDGRHRLKAAQEAGAEQLHAKIATYDSEGNKVWHDGVVSIEPKKATRVLKEGEFNEAPKLTQEEWAKKQGEYYDYQQANPGAPRLPRSFADYLEAEGKHSAAQEEYEKLMQEIEGFEQLPHDALQARGAMRPIIEQIEASAKRGTFDATQKLKSWVAEQVNWGADNKFINGLRRRASGIVASNLRNAEDKAALEGGLSPSVNEGLKIDRLAYALHEMIGDAIDKLDAKDIPKSVLEKLAGATRHERSLPILALQALGIPAPIAVAAGIGLPFTKRYLAQQTLKRSAQKLLGESTTPETNTLLHAMQTSDTKIKDGTKDLLSALGSRSASAISFKKSDALKDFVPHGVAAKDSFDSLRRAATEAQSNPEAYARHLGNITAGLRAEGLHQVADEYTKHQIRLMKVLQTILPADPTMKQAHPFSSNVEIDEIDPSTKAKINRALTIAADPVKLLDMVKSNNITAGDVALAAAVNPSTLQKLREELVKESIKSKPNLTYQNRLSLSILMGEHLDESTEQLPVLQGSYGGTKPSAGKPKKAHTNSLKMSGKSQNNLQDAYLTQSEKVLGH